MRRVCLFVLLAGCGGTDDGEPTFEAVAPILATSCNGCHRSGGAAPMSFESHALAAPHAAAMARAAAERTMPPFGVSHGGDCNSYRDARWLDDEAIALLGRWAEAGAPAGNVDAAPAPPERALERVDALAAMAEDYLPAIDGADDYRCFVLDPALAADAYLEGYRVVPGVPEMVHHVILFGTVSAEADAAASAADAADEGAGYACFGGPGIGYGGMRFLAGWAPGTGATRYPAGTGIRMRGGRKMIMQVHYNLGHGAAADRTAVELMLGAAVAEPAEVLPIADLEMQLAPGQADAVHQVSVDYDKDHASTLFGVYPHMHLRGRTLRVERERAGVTSCVVDVPRWDFDWQEFFFYAEPLDAQPGDRFTLSCHFDTRGDTAPVRWGEGTSDEMCLAGFYFSPPILE